MNTEPNFIIELDKPAVKALHCLLKKQVPLNQHLLRLSSTMQKYLYANCTLEEIEDLE